jgi:hypothetical protein
LKSKFSFMHVFQHYHASFYIQISHYMLTPKIPLDQKLVVCCLGSLCEEKLKKFNSFF